MTEALMRFYNDPEMAKRVGYAASQTLYCSWEDSIAKAYDRYNYILDLHKRGELVKPKASMDGMISMAVECYKGIDKVKSIYRDDTV